MSRYVFESDGEDATRRLGRRLAEVLPAACVVGLEGPLGAGKTLLVRAVAEACGVDPRDVVSPTFVLVQQYDGNRRLVHIDAYRLADSDEFLAMGGEEYLDAADAVTFIEWAGRIEDCLPAERLAIRIEVVDERRRRLEIEAAGAACAAAVEALAGDSTDRSDRTDDG